MLGTLIQAWNKTNRWHRGNLIFALYNHWVVARIYENSNDTPTRQKCLLMAFTNHLVVGIFTLVQFGIIPQRIAGFYCNDAKLAHPYTGDTISWKLLLAVSILLPLCVMFVVEADQSFKYTVTNRLKRGLVLKWYGEYSFGLLINIIMVQYIKVLVAEPRPHFFDVCNPDSDCKGNEFVPSYQCTKTIYSDSRMADSARSFPSGHTSIALHAGLFLAWYLHKRTKHFRGSAYYLIALTQVVLVFTAVLCGLSRITDHRHHWWDVLAGAVLGVAILIYTIRHLCDNFECLNGFASTESTCGSDSTEALLDQEISENYFKATNGTSKTVLTHL